MSIPAAVGSVVVFGAVLVLLVFQLRFSIRRGLTNKELAIAQRWFDVPKVARRWSDRRPTASTIFGGSTAIGLSIVLTWRRSTLDPESTEAFVWGTIAGALVSGVGIGAVFAVLHSTYQRRRAKPLLDYLRQRLYWSFSEVAFLIERMNYRPTRSHFREMGITGPDPASFARLGRWLNDNRIPNTSDDKTLRLVRNQMLSDVRRVEWCVQLLWQIGQDSRLAACLLTVIDAADRLEEADLERMPGWPETPIVSLIGGLTSTIAATCEHLGRDARVDGSQAPFGELTRADEVRIVRQLRARRHQSNAKLPT